MFSFTGNWIPFQLLHLWYNTSWKSGKEKFLCGGTQLLSDHAGIQGLGKCPGSLAGCFWLVNVNEFTRNWCIRICFVAFWQTYQGSYSCNKHQASTSRKHIKKSLDLRIQQVISLYRENILTSIRKTGLSLVTVLETGLLTALADESAELLLTKSQIHRAFFWSFFKVGSPLKKVDLLLKALAGFFGWFLRLISS